MALTNPDIIQLLVDKFGDALTEFGEPYGMLTFSAPSSNEFKSDAVSL